MKTAIQTLFVFLLDYLTKGRKQDRKKFARETWIEKKSESEIAVIFWNTTIITAYQNGDIKLNAGGHRTFTTKDRINRFDLNGFEVIQDKSIWYVAKHYWDKSNPDRTVYGFEDNMIITKRGKVKGALSLKQIKEKGKLKKDVQKYCKDFIDALFKGNVKKPKNSDCWYCCMRVTNEDDKTLGEAVKEHSKDTHLKEHIKEKYYVPSLLQRAIEKFKVSQVVKEVLHQLWYGNLLPVHFIKPAKEQLESSLKRYMYSQLNLAS